MEARQWTSSRVRFTPPPERGAVVNGQIIGELRQVGTFDPTLFNEVRQNAAPRSAPMASCRRRCCRRSRSRARSSTTAPPRSFDQVLTNVTHRSAGTGGVDTLTNAADRAKVATFLRSIDLATAPLP